MKLKKNMRRLDYQYEKNRDQKTEDSVLTEHSLYAGAHIIRQKNNDNSND